ncbi:MAG TPA: hypothetical protein VH413_08880 [Verrucomicrobiae bacterium]|jgi:hypothetical protein|nr:hypothetical protein [Verrucomicrobiae bacterium]
MTADAAESRHWSRHRWVVSMLVILLVQIVLILILGRSQPTPLPAFNFGPKVYLPANPREPWPGLSDAVQFVLANRHGFSGGAWLQFQPPEYDLQPWTEPPRPLMLPVEKLGDDLANYVHANLNQPFELTPKPEPEIQVVIPDENLGVAHSALTIEGELANRPLLTPIKLSSWPANDILTDSEVLVGVDEAGNVFSSVLVVAKGSGSKEADAAALRLAAQARFRPLLWTGPGRPPESETRLHWGRMIFHWRTVPMPAAKTPAALP